MSSKSVNTSTVALGKKCITSEDLAVLPCLLSATMSSTTTTPARLPCRKQLANPAQGEPSSSGKPKSNRRPRPKLRRQHPGIYEAFSLLEKVKNPADFLKAALQFISALKLCWNTILDSAESVKSIDYTALRTTKAAAVTACENSLRGWEEARRSRDALTVVLDVITRELATVEEYYRTVMVVVCKDKPLPGLPDEDTDDDSKPYCKSHSNLNSGQDNTRIPPPTDSSKVPRAARPSPVSTHAKSGSTSSTVTVPSAAPSIFSHSSRAKNSSTSSTSTAQTDVHTALPLELVFNSVFNEQQELKKQRLAEQIPEQEKPAGGLHRLKQKLANSTLSLPGLSIKGGKGSANSAPGPSGSKGGDEDLDGFQEAYRGTFYGNPGEEVRQVKRRNSDLAAHSTILGPGGEVQKGTIQGLLCVVTSSEHSDNRHLHSTLLNEFRRFVKPIDFVTFMRQRYRKNYTYRIRVANLLLLWVHSHWQPQDMPAFAAILEFVQDMESDDTVPERTLASLREALDHPRLGNNFPSRLEISEKALKVFLPIDILAVHCDWRRGIAEQITFVASELYRRVDKSLLIRYWMGDKSEKQKLALESADNWKLTEVLAIPAFEEALAKWVSYTVTQGDDVTARSQLIGFWLEVAEVC